MNEQNLPMSKPKSNKERLARLEDVFAKQMIIALAENKIRGIASMEKICELASVEKKYVYGHVECSPESKKEYENFHDRVKKFNKNFIDSKKDRQKNAASEGEKYQQALEQNHELIQEKVELEVHLKQSQKRLKTLMAEKAHLQAIANEATNSNTENNIASISDITVAIISPDAHLERDGQYDYKDPKMRDKAWTKARSEFASLMRRKIPQRVYILVGAPCAGKTTWAKEKRIVKDRHAVIIDATNLTSGDRAKWIMQARKASDVKICAVRFISDYSTLASRNMNRGVKKIDALVLESKFNSIEPIDPSFEDIDEVLFVKESYEY